MTLLISRRKFLTGAASAAAATAFCGLFGADVLASAIPQGHSPRSHARKPAFASIDLALQEAVDKRTVAGVVRMGATDRSLVYEGSFGHADRAAGTAISPDTVFWLLSMTKAITATACMQLIEQGKLKLDQPSEILPELKSPLVLEGFDATGKPRLRPARRPITMRHLLTHTSGYTYSIWSENISRYEKVTGMADIAFSNRLRRRRGESLRQIRRGLYSGLAAT
jgi:methyl acetate hydrolase